ncbi:MAG: sugar phosphate isomerase/epimerase [Anaerolineales bacterium]
MKIGLFTDSLADMAFEQALDWAAEHGIEAVEIGTGNFSPAPHCDLENLVQSQDARRLFRSAVETRGLTVSALNCNGNLLDPHPRRRETAQLVFHRTLKAASHLGIGTVVTMSGCPGDLEGGTSPNWVTCTWQREYLELLDRQWEGEIAPFWSSASQEARDLGVRIAIEAHPGQAVYNFRTLERLRQVCGDQTVGANLDPSHFFFQMIDPVAVVRALGEGAIFHVHAKDTRINGPEMALNGSLDTRPMAAPGIRSWEYVTLGFGHDAFFWRSFLASLRMSGFDGVLSIEHEDQLMSPREGIEKSVTFLTDLVPRTMA